MRSLMKLLGHLTQNLKVMNGESLHIILSSYYGHYIMWDYSNMSSHRQTDFTSFTCTRNMGCVHKIQI